MSKTSSQSMKYVLFIGSTRAKRIGPKVAEHIQRSLLTRDKNAQVTVVDPRTTENGFFMRLLEKPLFHYKADEKDLIPEALTKT
eukprot:Awhi_evm1s10103